MKAVIIREQTLDEARDALLDKLKTNCDEDTDSVSYRTIHYHVYEFVRKLKECGL